MSMCPDSGEFSERSNGDRIYAPLRNPDYNDSDYRTNVSFPNWDKVRMEK